MTCRTWSFRHEISPVVSTTVRADIMCTNGTSKRQSGEQEREQKLAPLETPPPQDLVKGTRQRRYNRRAEVGGEDQSSAAGGMVGTISCFRKSKRKTKNI